MFQIFNKPALTRRQRFAKALYYGFLIMIACVITKILLYKLFTIYFALLYIPIGYAIGYGIQYFGRGVQIQFSILAAVLTFVAIIICDLAVYGSIQYILFVLSSFGVNSLFEVGYRLFAIYVAFSYAKIV